MPGNCCLKCGLGIQGSPLSPFELFGFQTLESLFSMAIGSILKPFIRGGDYIR